MGICGLNVAPPDTGLCTEVHGKYYYRGLEVLKGVVCADRTASHALHRS